MTHIVVMDFIMTLVAFKGVKRHRFVTNTNGTTRTLTVNKTKNFWLFSPTQLLTHGQWWSILRIQRRQTLKEANETMYMYSRVSP